MCAIIRPLDAYLYPFPQCVTFMTSLDMYPYQFPPYILYLHQSPRYVIPLSVPSTCTTYQFSRHIPSSVSSIRTLIISLNNTLISPFDMYPLSASTMCTCISVPSIFTFISVPSICTFISVPSRYLSSIPSIYIPLPVPSLCTLISSLYMYSTYISALYVYLDHPLYVQHLYQCPLCVPLSVPWRQEKPPPPGRGTACACPP